VACDATQRQSVRCVTLLSRLVSTTLQGFVCFGQVLCDVTFVT
jgi:hypothetical protein